MRGWTPSATRGSSRRRADGHRRGGPADGATTRSPSTPPGNHVPLRGRAGATTRWYHRPARVTTRGESRPSGNRAPMGTRAGATTRPHHRPTGERGDRRDGTGRGDPRGAIGRRPYRADPVTRAEATRPPCARTRAGPRQARRPPRPTSSLGGQPSTPRVRGDGVPSLLPASRRPRSRRARHVRLPAGVTHRSPDPGGTRAIALPGGKRSGRRLGRAPCRQSRVHDSLRASLGRRPLPAHTRLPAGAAVRAPYRAGLTVDTAATAATLTPARRSRSRPLSRAGERGPTPRPSSTRATAPAARLAP